MENKKIALIQSENVATVLKRANELSLKKEDIITIIEVKGLIYLIYQK